MKILHVSMGIPPFRVGGLNEYCLELMEQQVIDGHKVALLYPGEFGITKSVKVIKAKSYYLSNVKESKCLKISLYKIRNPLPLPLVFGINSPERYMVKCDKQIYMDFINEYNPEVIHVHSIQGIHKEFFEAAHFLGKKIVFTTHDYYPICFKCFLYNEYNGICNDIDHEKCAICNLNSGLSKKQEFVMQSRLYTKMKYSKIIKTIRSRSRKKVTESSKCVDLNKIVYKDAICEEKINRYKDLSNYYKSIMSKIDVVHCNSNLAQSIYQKHYPDSKYCTIPITRKSLGYGKIQEKSNSENDYYLSINKTNKNTREVIIGYVGGLNPVKGLNTLIDAVFYLDNIGDLNWKLHLYGGDYSSETLLDSRIINCGFYDNKTKDDVYSSFDVLVVPSLCPETFGFVVPEALSVGIPVICSSMVGSKSCIQDKHTETDKMHKNSEFVFEPGNAKELSEKILKVVTKKPCFNVKMPDNISQHSKHIQEKIYMKYI